MIDLATKKMQVIETAQRYFHYITSLPLDIRPVAPDAKIRTGLRVFLREPEPVGGQRNQIAVSAFLPSVDAEIFAIEKAVRSWTLGDYSSQNSADPEKLRFAGCVTVKFRDQIIQCSCSGLSEKEDAGGAVIILADLLQAPPINICDNVRGHDGLLPEEFFDRYHYLNWIIKNPNLNPSSLNRTYPLRSASVK